MDESKNIEIVRKMFAAAERLDASQIDNDFTPDYVMYSNDVEWDLQTYKDFHIDAYKKRKGLTVTWDDVLAQGDRVAGRVRIVLIDNDDSQKEFQVIFIAQIRDSKICRLWELTYPHWT